MGDYLPDIDFDRPQNHNADTSAPNYTQNRLGPIRIIKDAFVKYIGNNQEYNINVALRILHAEPDGTTYNIFLVKSKNSVNNIVLYETISQFRSIIDRLGDVDILKFNNGEIDQFLNRIRNYKIVEVVLCEEYNGDTIDLKVLYRLSSSPFGIDYSSHYSDRVGWNGMYRLPISVQRRLENNPIESNYVMLSMHDDRERKRYLTNLTRTIEEQRVLNAIEEQQQIQNAILMGLDNPLENSVDGTQRQIQNAIEEQRTRMQNLENPSEEYLDNLLQNWPVEIPQDLSQNSEESTPTQLITINPEDTMDGGMTGQELLSLPVSNHEWGGMCYICHDSDTNGLCRVDCSRGHIFHCECIDFWRNTKKTNQYYNYGWHEDCPMCHELITYKVPLTPGMAASLPSSFGKRCRSCTSRKTCKSCIKKRLSKAKKNIKNIIKGNSFGKKTIGKINSEEKYLRSFI